MHSLPQQLQTCAQAVKLCVCGDTVATAWRDVSLPLVQGPRSTSQHTGVRAQLQRPLSQDVRVQTARFLSIASTKGAVASVQSGNCCGNCTVVATYLHHCACTVCCCSSICVATHRTFHHGAEDSRRFTEAAALGQDTADTVGCCQVSGLLCERLDEESQCALEPIFTPRATFS
jgi:hypothetical protein